VASVDGSGLVIGLAEGSATITATSEGQHGMGTVSVRQTGTGPLVNECSAPGQGWIWCDDFEQDRLSHYFEYSNPNGNSFVRSNGVGVAGSHGMRVHFNTSQVDAGYLHLAFGKTPDPYFRPVDAGTAVFREIYWRMYMKYDPNWTGGGGKKLSRATVLASPAWAQAMIGHLWSGGDQEHFLTIDPASGTDDSLHDLGSRLGTRNIVHRHGGTKRRQTLRNRASDPP